MKIVSKGGSMSTFNERLEKALKSKDMTNSELAKKVSVSRQAVTRWLNEGVIPENKTVIAIAEAVDVPAGYLLFGEEGSLNSVEDDDYVCIPVLDVYGGCYPAGRYNSLAVMVSMIRVAKEWVLARSKSPNFSKLHIINAYGDSMKPNIDEGDFVIVDTSKNELIGDGVYAIQSGGNTFIKRVQRQINGSILLLSDNPLYKPYEVPVEELDSLTIVGKCIIVCNAREL